MEHIPSSAATGEDSADIPERTVPVQEVLDIVEAERASAELCHEIGMGSAATFGMLVGVSEFIQHLLNSRGGDYVFYFRVARNGSKTGVQLSVDVREDGNPGQPGLPGRLEARLRKETAFVKTWASEVSFVPLAGGKVRITATKWRTNERTRRR